MIFQKEPLCVLGTLHLAHKANATLTKMLLKNNNIGDRGAVALAAAVKALFVTMFFRIVRTVCSLFLDLFISCTDDSVPLG